MKQKVIAVKLDIGCGGGKYVFHPKIVEQAVVYADIERPELKVKNFVVLDAQYLPFRDNVFLEVYASHVIEHLEKPNYFARESYRILSRSGKLHIWTPNFLSVNAKLDPQHRNIYNFYTLMKTLKSNGYAVAFPRGNFGSRIPLLIRKLIKAVYLFVCEELYIVANKK